MRQSRTLPSGREGPQDAMALASGAPAHGAEVLARGASGTRPGDFEHLVRKRPAQAPPRRVVDAA